jgi:hypothetical protein
MKNTKKKNLRIKDIQEIQEENDSLEGTEVGLQTEYEE